MKFALERGQGLVEYGFILVLIAVVVILSVTLLGGTIQNMFDRVNSGIAAGTGP